MAKLKKARFVKKKGGPISDADRSQIEEVYRIRALAANGAYLTPVMHNKSTVVRMTFVEYNFTLQKNIAVSAVYMSIEDVQNIYNALTELLQQMRQLGRIE